MELPYLKFWHRDWLGDTQLRLCSLTARGLWIDILSICAANAARAGYLAIGGKALDAATIARVICAEATEVQKALDELEGAGVFSRDEHGCIYSRRMVRDAVVSEQKRKAGLQGGNPALVKPVLKHPVKRKDKQHVKPVLKPRVQSPESRVKALSSLSNTTRPTKPKKLQGYKKVIAERFETALAVQWVNDAGKWVERIKANVLRCERIVAEVESAAKESRINTTPAQYAEFIWDDFNKRMAA